MINAGISKLVCTYIKLFFKEIINSLTSCLFTSKVNRHKKQVICRKKLIKSATPAYKANNLTAGISVRAPEMFL